MVEVIDLISSVEDIDDGYDDKDDVDSDDEDNDDVLLPLSSLLECRKHKAPDATDNKNKNVISKHVIIVACNFSSF
jgi:hypothetical protein